MDDEKWHIFVGDRVQVLWSISVIIKKKQFQVMVGKEKGKQGTVIKVSRDTSEVSIFILIVAGGVAK